MKKATTIEEQIQLLENRGMIISDKEKAKEYLLDIGYYRLGFYWFYFIKDRHKQLFYNNINISDSIDLYYLDVDLRNLLLKYIYRIEVHFRTQIVYHVSNEYKDNPLWFSDSTLVRKIDLSIYNKLKEKNTYIMKHHAKYGPDGYAPAWKNLEFLTFGQILNTYNNIKDNTLKEKIAGIYEIADRSIKKKDKSNRKKVVNTKSYTILYEYLTAVLNIRNICSHSGVLFDYKQPKAIRKIPDPTYRPKGNNPESLNASIHLIYFILSKISTNRADELIIEVKNILTKAITKNNKLKNVLITHSCFEI